MTAQWPGGEVRRVTVHSLFDLVSVNDEIRLLE